MIVFWLKHRGTSYPIHRGDCILGRTPGCFVVLSAEKVSREHALVRLTDEGGVEVVDLGSRNGTRVNGEQIDGRRELNAGDAIEVGGERLQIMRRVRRDLPDTVDDDVSDHDATQRVQRTILELTAELVARATEDAEREALSRTIHNVVDTLIQNINRNGCKLTEAECVELATVAQIVASWSGDTTLEGWYDDVTRAVGQN